MTTRTLLIKISLACLILLTCGQFAHSQPKREIFKKEMRQIDKMYQALLAGDAVKYQNILQNIESSEAPQYLITMRYMIDLGQTAYRILIEHDNEAYTDYCKLYPLTEKIAPSDTKTIIRNLKNSVEKNMIVATP